MDGFVKYKIPYLNTKEARNRLEHPLEDTFERISNGSLDPNIFPFYHVGVTLTAGDCKPGPAGEYLLETPCVINGCQTINIADRFLRRLEKEKADEKLKRFRSIPVLAKVVVAATDEQVREIANCNNRQNPIEAWQLFSNEPIHVRIEEAFEQIGVFYERQRGKFDAEMKHVENLNRYYATNKTKITVEELGQLITLCRRQIQIAAKPSEIFTTKQTHDEVFDWTILPNPRMRTTSEPGSARRRVESVRLRPFRKEPQNAESRSSSKVGRSLRAQRVRVECAHQTLNLAFEAISQAVPC